MWSDSHILYVKWCQVPMPRGDHTQHPQDAIYIQRRHSSRKNNGHNHIGVAREI